VSFLPGVEENAGWQATFGVVPIAPRCFRWLPMCFRAQHELLLFRQFHFQIYQSLFTFISARPDLFLRYLSIGKFLDPSWHSLAGHFAIASASFLFPSLAHKDPCISVSRCSYCQVSTRGLEEEEASSKFPYSIVRYLSGNKRSCCCGASDTCTVATLFLVNAFRPMLTSRT